MKLGILLFGHLRTFEYSSKYFIKNIAKKYDCDIFIHTWDELDSSTKCWEKREQKNLKVDEKVISKIKKIYNPKKLYIGHQNVEKEVVVISSDEQKEVSLNGMNFMFESLEGANNLRKEYEKETGVKYDYLLVTRPDVAVYNYLDIEATIEEAKSLNIDINNARFFAGLYGNSKTNVKLLINRVPDILFFGLPKVIDRFIDSNKNLTYENVNKTFKNVVSIYVRNEIKAGNIPYEICFACGSDWKNHTQESLKELLEKTKYKEKTKEKISEKSKLYKFTHFYWLRGKK